MSLCQILESRQMKDLDRKFLWNIWVVKEFEKNQFKISELIEKVKIIFYSNKKFKFRIACVAQPHRV